MAELRHESVDLEQVFLNFTTGQVEGTAPTEEIETLVEDISSAEETDTQTEEVATGITVAEEE